MESLLLASLVHLPTIMVFGAVLAGCTGGTDTLSYMVREEAQDFMWGMIFILSVLVVAFLHVPLSILAKLRVVFKTSLNMIQLWLHVFSLLATLRMDVVNTNRNIGNSSRHPTDIILFYNSLVVPFSVGLLWGMCMGFVKMTASCPAAYPATSLMGADLSLMVNVTASSFLEWARVPSHMRPWPTNSAAPSGVTSMTH